jgi:hypothetical protein
MSPWMLRVGVCVFMVITTGCTIVNNYGPKEVVPGTVSQVAAKLQDGLTEAGMVVNAKQDGDECRIAGTSKSNTVFCIHLRQKKGVGSPNTLVRMQWDLGGDEELWNLVLQLVKVPAQRDPDNP